LRFDQLMNEIGSISWRLANWKHQLSFAANSCFQSHSLLLHPPCDFTHPLAAGLKHPLAAEIPKRLTFCSCQNCLSMRLESSPCRKCKLEATACRKYMFSLRFCSEGKRNQPRHWPPRQVHGFVRPSLAAMVTHEALLEIACGCPHSTQLRVLGTIDM